MSEPGIVFYDGTCGFCDWSVQWLLRHDKTGAFVFAPLRVRPRMRRDPDGHITSVVLMLPGHPDAARASDAVLAILSARSTVARARGARLLPRFLRDPFCRLFARYRYVVAGKIDACPFRPEDRPRFLP